nr:hypothetical protein [Calditrichia bacterium]
PTDRAFGENPEGLFAGVDSPWRLQLNLDYSYRDNLGRIEKRFSGNMTADLKLTKNWRANMRANLDLISRELIYPSFSINRDLHCWRMSFEWSPNSYNSYYRLLIQVDESMLQDLKLTKSSGRSVY